MRYGTKQHREYQNWAFRGDHETHTQIYTTGSYPRNLNETWIIPVAHFIRLHQVFIAIIEFRAINSSLYTKSSYYEFRENEWTQSFMLNVQSRFRASGKLSKNSKVELSAIFGLLFCAAAHFASFPFYPDTTNQLRAACIQRILFFRL